MRKSVSWLTLSLLLAGCSYLPEGIMPEPTIETVETPDYIGLLPAGQTAKNTALLFYPGGLVDPHAYRELLEDFVVSDGYPVMILKVSANLAIWNGGKAKRVKKQFPEVGNWVIAGHSLGGVVAAMAVDKEPDSYAGLVLMASYSISALGDWNGPAMVLSAENDAVGDPAELTNNESNLPPRQDIANLAAFPITPTASQTLYYEIPGGNHSGFGSYGFQEGDGEASISPSEQQAQVRALIRAFLAANQLDN